MTNGEKIKATFPHYDIEIDEHKGYVRIFYENFYTTYPWGWWNSEYQEPTAKNDLVSSIVEKISEKVTETREEFIFETIRPYCENVVQMKISKRDLEQALLKYYGKNDLGVDCIIRTSALDSINWAYNLSDAYQKINELPSVTPQEPRWILTTERLPKDRDWYLGIFKEPDTGWINPLPFICDYVGSKTKTTTKEYWILRGFTDRDEHIDYYFNLECVAWMPLPESFEPQESEG